MKKIPAIYALLLAANFAFQPLPCTAQATGANLSAEEIFRKTIQYYDPKGLWSGYQGTMRLYSVFEENIGYEEISINNAQKMYQSIRYLNDSTFTKGVKAGVFFFEINGKKFTEREVPEKFKKEPYNLTSDNVRMLQEHHTFHFSGPLMLKALGAVPSPSVGSESLFGVSCVSIHFPEGVPNNFEQGGYNGAITLYLNPQENYKVHAILLDNGWFKENKGMLTLYSGEIEIAGLKIPSRRLYFHAADGSYGFIDAFEPVK
jgi:hypothetical protein